MRIRVAAVTLVALLGIAALAGCATPRAPQQPTQLPQTAIFTIASECVRSSGFTDAISFEVVDGEITVTSPGGSPDPDGPLRQLGECLARYPVDAGYTDPPRQIYLLLVLDYELHVLTPCLEAQGYDIDPPPSRVDYLSGDYWTAYQSVDEMNLRGYVALATACPPKPAYLRGGH